MGETTYKFERSGKTYYIVKIPEVDSDEATAEIEGEQVSVKLNPSLGVVFGEVTGSYGYRWMVIDRSCTVDTFATIVTFPIQDPRLLYEIVEGAVTAKDADVVKLSSRTYAILYWTD